MNKDVVKQQLRFIYQGQNSEREQANLFFTIAFQSSEHIETLFKLLLDIAITEEDSHLKQSAIIIIKHFDFNYLQTAIKFLHEQMDPIYYSLLEILTDTLCKNFREQAYEFVNQMLAVQQNDLIQKIVLQILNSLFTTNTNYYKEKENAKLIKPFSPIIFEHIKTFLNFPSLDLNHLIILCYFFQTNQSMFASPVIYETVHNLTCLCLNQRAFPIPEAILDSIFDAYKSITFLSRGKLPFDQFFVIFDSYCKATNTIPIQILSIASYIMLYEDSSLTFSYFQSLIIDYIFPKLKINPDDLLHNQESFLDLYQPDFSSDLPVSILYSNLMCCYPNETISLFVFEFSMAYFSENQTDPIEIANIMNFLLRFLHSSKLPQNTEYKIQFVQAVVLPIMSSISNVPIDQSLDFANEVLSIAICNFFTDTFESLQSFLLIPEVYGNAIVFMRRLALDQTNDQLTHLVFYFTINAIQKLMKVLDFQFTDVEAYQLYTKTYEVANEFPTVSVWDAMNRIIKQALSLNPNIIENVIQKTWENYLINRESGEDLQPILNLLKEILEYYGEQKDHNPEVQLHSSLLIIDLLKGEVESEHGVTIVVSYYSQIFEIILSIVEQSTNDDNVLDIMSIVAEIIFSIMMVLIENKDNSTINEEFDDSVFLLSTMAFTFLHHINEADKCLDCLVQSFIFKLLPMINAILERGVRKKFSFECLNGPITKFYNDPQILDFYLANTQNIFQLTTFDGQNELLASLIIANPSLYFQFADQFLQSSQQIAAVIYEFAVLRILQYFQQTQQDLPRVISLIEQFTELLHDQNNPLIGEDGTICFYDDDDHYIDKNMFPMEYYQEVEGVMQPNFIAPIESIISLFLPK